MFKESPNFGYIANQFSNEDNLKKMMTYFDHEEANLYNYIYLRRLNYAWKTCAEGFEISPSRLGCALTATSARTTTLLPNAEKGFFAAAVTLWDGFNLSQINGLNAIQYSQIATIYHYFSEYEISFNNYIRREEVVRAI